MAKLRSYVDDINADPNALAKGQRGPHSKYILPEEELTGKVELKFYDNVGKGWACNLDSKGACGGPAAGGWGRTQGSSGVWVCVGVGGCVGVRLHLHHTAPTVECMRFFSLTERCKPLLGAFEGGNDWQLQAPSTHPPSPP